MRFSINYLFDNHIQSKYFLFRKIIENIEELENVVHELKNVMYGKDMIHSLYKNYQGLLDPS
ncbi:MAG: hypothetical protein ACOCT9_02440 [archaeon]